MEHLCSITAPCAHKISYPSLDSPSDDKRIGTTTYNAIEALSMMSEPLRQPQPPHAMGMNGKGSVKRKLDRNSDGSGGEEEGSGAKRRKEVGL